jgi:hypothetical protein
VEQKPSEAEGLSPELMLEAAQDCQKRLLAHGKTTGLKGSFLLHPTGPAIVKKTVHLLGESLGTGPALKEAKRLQEARKAAPKKSKAPPEKGKDEGKEKPSSKEPETQRLHPSVLPEHFASLESMRGKTPAASIIPKVGSGSKYKSEDTENMLATTQKGNEQYQRYQAALKDEDEKEKEGVGLDISVNTDALPKVINKLWWAVKIAKAKQFFSKKKEQPQ